MTANPPALEPTRYHRAVVACLRERGYRQFRLTDDQRRQLRRLRHGTDERRAFLHSLASNPRVLEAQGL